MKTKHQHTNNNNVDKNLHLMEDYLNNNLSEEERYKLEESMMEDSFEADALEGLQQINKKDLNAVQQNLSKYIRNNLRKRKRYTDKPILFPVWIMLAIILLIGIVVIGFLIISRLSA
jgi:CRISPR/Cas system-associated protein Cas7 (RAMP superfamily)